MKLGLINSAWLDTSVGLAQGVQLTKEIGFDSIDIFADPLSMRPEDLKTFSDACSSEGLPVISAVCCALGLADFNEPVRRFHVDRAKQFVDLCHKLRGKNVVLVMGEYIWNQEVIPPADQWKWAVEGARALGEYAAPFGLEIALELEPFPLSIVNNVDKMARFLTDVDHPQVRANVDISHLVLAHDMPETIKKLTGRIAHVHLSDCDGIKHGDLPPGRGVVDFRPYLKALAESGFDGAVSLELEYSPEPGKIVDWVREAYQSTSGIMESLGIRSKEVEVY